MKKKPNKGPRLVMRIRAGQWIGILGAGSITLGPVWHLTPEAALATFIAWLKQ